MARNTDNFQIYAGLDIGSSRVRVVVVKRNSDASVDILGHGSAVNTGMRKGVVVNIEQTEKAIRQAIAGAELESGVQIKSVVVGISGRHIQSQNGHGVVGVHNKSEITKADVSRVLESALAVNIPEGYEVLHVLPQQYTVDGQGDIKEPVGMTGVRLEVEVHIVTGARTCFENVVKSCNRAGLVIAHIHLVQLAAGEAVLSEDEKELGVAIIDCGGGTTDIAAYKKGEVYFTKVLELGGGVVTRDLMVFLSSSEAEAERIKVANGSVWMDRVGADEMVEVASVGGRTPQLMSRPVITQVLQARVDEMLTMVRGDLLKINAFENLNAGVVITGGLGKFDGIEELAYHVLGCPVRIGRVSGVGGFSDMVNDPVYATAVGLAKLHAAKGYSPNNVISGKDDENSLMERLKGFFKEFF